MQKGKAKTHSSPLCSKLLLKARDSMSDSRSVKYAMPCRVSSRAIAIKTTLRSMRSESETVGARPVRGK